MVALITGLHTEFILQWRLWDKIRRLRTRLTRE